MSRRGPLSDNATETVPAAACGAATRCAASLDRWGSYTLRYKETDSGELGGKRVLRNDTHITPPDVWSDTEDKTIPKTRGGVRPGDP